MTKEEFLQLQESHQQSGLSLKSYLQQIGTGYSTYNYWRKKYLCQEEPSHDLAPISFRSSSDAAFANNVPSGATLLFPNGLRAHFGAGSEEVLREFLLEQASLWAERLDKNLMSHVLP